MLTHCAKCRARQLKLKHPATYVFNTFRTHARNRKIPFTITLAEFREFCKQTGYLELRGQQPGSLTIDRKNHDEGYHHWNICVKSHAENSTNGHTVPGVDCPQNQPKPKAWQLADENDPNNPF